MISTEDISETMLVIITCENKKEYFSLSFDRRVIAIKFDELFFNLKAIFFTFYFLNMDISFNI